MKTCFTLAFLIACGLLSWTSCSSGQPAQARFEIQGKLTVQGRVIRIGDDYGVQAGTLKFVLDHLSRTDGRILNQFMGKGITVQGSLRTKSTAQGLVLVIDVSAIKGGGDGFLDARVEGDVELRGLLTKELPHHGDYRISHGLKPDAFILNRVWYRQFSPVLFSGEAAKKAANLYGGNVILQCRLEVRALGSRSECMIFTLRDLERDSK